MIILKKNPEKPYVVLCINDINMDANEWLEGTKTREDLLRTTRALVEKTQPDLIILTGDLSYAGLMDCYEKVRDLMESFALPWTFIFGNHDEERGPKQTELQADFLMRAPHCLFEKGPADLGLGNFVLRIDEGDKPVYSLVMMDSHTDEFLKSDFGEKLLVQGRIHDNQWAWYRETLSSLPVKNTLIAHIPLPLYQRAFEEAWNFDFNPKTTSVRESQNPACWNIPGAYGVRHEKIFCYPSEFGELKTMQESGKTELVLAAHDHVNNFVIPYHGITLAYVLKTGSGCYAEEGMNGGTVLRIDEGHATLEHIYI